MASLLIRNVAKSFGPVEVLRDINLSVADGEFVVFVGPSGCGKSTLLRLICGLEEVDGGELAIDGEVVNDVPPAKRGIAMVFQSYALYPHMNVAQNMSYSLKLAGVSREETARRVREAAQTLRLEALLDRKPRQLSGGQRQRVAIGRAIVRQPRIFLFDEPLSNLDAALRVDMRMEIAALKTRLGATMIYVTHDQIEAMTLADKIVVMNAGRIEQVGSPLDLYRAPANAFVARFIGSPRMNMLPLTRNESGSLVLPGGAPVPPALAATSGATLLGVRAEHLRLTSEADAGLRGAVRAVEHLGSDVFIQVAVEGADELVIVRIAGDARIRAGDPASLAIDPAAVHLFDATGRRCAPGQGIGA